MYLSTCMYIYSQFSLFGVDMFYKVTPNTEVANFEPLLLEEVQGYVPVSLGHNILVNIYLCIFESASI